MGRRVAPLAGAVLLVAGCGDQGRRSAPPPRLPHAVGVALAARADGVGRLLQRGDGCGVRGLAGPLCPETMAAITARRVQPRLQETLLGTVTDLATRIVCVPPPPARAPAPAP